MLSDALSRLPCAELSSEKNDNDFPDTLFTKKGVNDVSTPAAENVAGVESVTITPACVEYTTEEVEDTSRLSGAL